MTKNKSPLLKLIFLLIFIGLTFISISSLTEANNTIGDKFFYLKKQTFWILISFASFYFFSKFSLKIIKKIAFLLYLFSIICLILVLIPGFSNQALGASRWLNLGLFSFQPSELLKLTSVIYFSLLFSVESKRNFLNLVIYLVIPFILIILEPNLSTAILISAIIISMFYLSGGKIMPLFLLCIALIGLSFGLIYSSPYRKARLNTLINPTETTSTSYHSNQIILSLSSGGIFGKGFANSDQKYRFLPKISTDSILAIIGEETGFIGITLILIIYMALITYLIKLASTITDDTFSALIISGTTCWITYQGLINIAAIANVIPLTGVPLPFISYGGSSLLTLMTAIGLVRNIEKKYSLLIYSNSDKPDKKKNYHYRHPSYSRPRVNSPTPIRSKK